MSENSKNNEKKLEDLLAFSIGIMEGKKGLLLIKKYENAIENVTPFDMVKLVDKQIQMGISPKDIKQDVNKVINIFYDNLNNYDWEKPAKGTFLYYLMLENAALKFKLNIIKKEIRKIKTEENTDFNSLKDTLLTSFQELLEFENHYIKKENILFPYIEEKVEYYRCIKVMWSIHDDIRKKLKEVISILASKDSSWEMFNKAMGAYFFLAFGMIQKEDLIIYPVINSIFDDVEQAKMQKQSFEYSFPFIETPPKSTKAEGKEEKTSFISQSEGELKFKSETGELNIEQIFLLLNNLPVDITFVDENNKVKFFSKPKDRFFPRSPAIIGREVKNCHPPESVHIVEKIINTFRKGEKDSAKFWIQLKGKFILIQYFALRNDKNEYKGVIEVSQDVSDIRTLEGEQRLLEWGK
ncbi:MAG: PAS domain-containing protein [Bacteroidota bacterium]|nr:PAS domain-containing protein [Bacteroidota bacterium]